MKTITLLTLLLVPILMFGQCTNKTKELTLHTNDTSTMIVHSILLDTANVIMLVSDTTRYYDYIEYFVPDTIPTSDWVGKLVYAVKYDSVLKPMNGNLWWMCGQEVFTYYNHDWQHREYLNDKGKEMPEKLVVWQSKRRK